MMSQKRESGGVRFFTSGDAASMKSLLPLLLGNNGEVEAVTWRDDREI